MKSISLFFLAALIVFSGAYGCSESGTGQNNEAPAITEQNGSPQNTNNNANTNAATGDNNTVPDDLSGTNVAPPPAPPTP